LKSAPLSGFLEPAVGRAALHFRVEPRQRDVVADVFAQAADVFDRYEDAITLRILELQELGGCPVCTFHLAGPLIPAQSVGGMDDKLAGREGGSELLHVFTIYTAPKPLSNMPGSECRAGAGDGHQPDRGEIAKGQPLTKQKEAGRRAHGRLQAHQDAEQLAR
jgi:hypothetical protein